MNQQDSNATLPRLQDPAAIARLVELFIKFGWPPSDEDVERWRRKSNDLGAAA
jgi:hypothetical protein